MYKNNLNVNPQIWQYGGLRMNEVNFLKFCLYVKLILKQDSIECEPKYNFGILIEEFVEGRPTVSPSQLWYYLEQKWSRTIVEYGLSVGNGWFNCDILESVECDNRYISDTYKLIYDEISKEVSTTTITLDDVVRYYNPKSPNDLLGYIQHGYLSRLFNRGTINSVILEYLYINIRSNIVSVQHVFSTVSSLAFNYLSNGISHLTKNTLDFDNTFMPPAVRSFDVSPELEFKPIDHPIIIPYSRGFKPNVLYHDEFEFDIDTTISDITKQLIQEDNIKMMKNIVNELKQLSREKGPIITATQGDSLNTPLSVKFLDDAIGGYNMIRQRMQPNGYTMIESVPYNPLNKKCIREPDPDTSTFEVRLIKRRQRGDGLLKNLKYIEDDK